MLSVEGLSAWYGRAQVLYDVSLSVKGGEVVVLLGRNGAGKSTAFRAILRLLSSIKGSVWFASRDISSLPTHEITRLGLGYVPEERRIFSDLTVLENLETGRQPPRAGVPEWTKDALFGLFPNLQRMERRRGGEMSGGEQQMLAIARTLMGNPSLVLLDEPSEGLAPKIVEDMAAALAAMKQRGLSILLAEQNWHFAALLADRAYIIEKGVIRFEGTLRELDGKPDLRNRYLAL